MLRRPAALANTRFDLLVIGGGAFGAAAAHDAALRGLSVALVEAADFGSGASAECFKMVHGGIRYIQHADIRRIRSSSRERSAMLRIAPHLVSPLPIAIPTYGMGRQGKQFLGTGMYLYDLLTLDRNRGIAHPSRQVPFTRFLTRDELLRSFPDVDKHQLTGAAVFDDGQMYNPARLVLAFVKSAARTGAEVCNYARAVRFLYDGDAVTGARIEDVLTGTEFDLHARLVLNAAGPGAEYLLQDEAKFGAWKRGHFSRDAYFIVNRRPQSKYALAVQARTADKDALLSRAARHLFIVPWRDRTLIGVWHRLFGGHPDETRVDEDELGSWLTEINSAYPSMALSRDDVITANFGLVPFGDGNSNSGELSFGKESRFIDHRITHGLKGLVTLIGIRFTTARGDAARALDLLLSQLPSAPRGPATDRIPLYGGAIADFPRFCADAAIATNGRIHSASLNALLRSHGTAFKEVLAMETDYSKQGQCLPATTTLVTEVSHAVRHESAVRLEDVVMRRTDLGAGDHPGEPVLEETAKLMGELLGWSEQRLVAELEATRLSLQRHHAGSLT